MKKYLIISAVAVFLFILSAQVSSASTWKSPYPLYTEDLKAGNCILVNTVTEQDSNHVYTLNPDNTIAINQSYYERWDRNARCDEIQFHVDHNTPISRLNSWLDDVAFSWYQNIGTSHFKHQTISTSKHEWFYVDENGIHRIPDILTGWSWGLLIIDRASIPHIHEGPFYQYVTIGDPLNFGNGQYVDKIHSIWKEEDRNFSTLPTRLAEAIRDRTYGYNKIFSSCPTSCGSSTDRSCGSLFDWRWWSSNSGYPACPPASERDQWRYNENVWQYNP